MIKRWDLPFHQARIICDQEDHITATIRMLYTQDPQCPPFFNNIVTYVFPVLNNIVTYVFNNIVTPVFNNIVTYVFKNIVTPVFE